MSAAYLQSHKTSVTSSVQNLPESEKDIYRVAKMLHNDVTDANSILGLGSWLPEKFKVTMDPVLNRKVYTPAIDEALLISKPEFSSSNIIIRYEPDLGYRIVAFLSLFIKHFWGYLITALAISLGAPFWFDLLNKLMQLRTSIKQPTDSTTNKSNDVSSPLNRIG